MTPADASDIDATAARISALIAERIGPKGPDLARQLRRAGRRLPRRVRRAVRHVVDAQALHGHPKLLRMVDRAALTAARDVAVSWLETVNPAERRKTAVIRWTAMIALNLLVVAALTVAFLVWRGIV